MCGISVFLSKKNKKNNDKTIRLLLDSLGLLQNRGYDSFGSSSLIKK